jgi:hypothetical protein
MLCSTQLQWDFYAKECEEGRIIMNRGEAGDVGFIKGDKLEAVFTADKESYIIFP